MHYAAVNMDLSLTNEEVKYVRNQQRHGQYENNNFPRNNNFYQGWRFEADPTNRPPYHHYTQGPQQQ